MKATVLAVLASTLVASCVQLGPCGSEFPAPLAAPLMIVADVITPGRAYDVLDLTGGDRTRADALRTRLSREVKGTTGITVQSPARLWVRGEPEAQAKTEAWLAAERAKR